MNMLVDRIEADNDVRTFKCRDCNGQGSVPWKTVDDWQLRMSEKIEDEIYKNIKRHGIRTVVQVARDVRRDGCRCEACDGCGEVYI